MMVLAMSTEQRAVHQRLCRNLPVSTISDAEDERTLAVSEGRNPKWARDDRPLTLGELDVMQVEQVKLCRDDYLLHMAPGERYSAAELAAAAGTSNKVAGMALSRLVDDLKVRRHCRRGYFRYSLA